MIASPAPRGSPGHSSGHGDGGRQPPRSSPPGPRAFGPRHGGRAAPPAALAQAGPHRPQRAAVVELERERPDAVGAAPLERFGSADALALGVVERERHAQALRPVAQGGELALPPARRQRAASCRAARPRRRGARSRPARCGRAPRRGGARRSSRTPARTAAAPPRPWRRCAGRGFSCAGARIARPARPRPASAPLRSAASSASCLRANT